MNSKEKFIAEAYGEYFYRCSPDENGWTKTRPQYKKENNTWYDAFDLDVREFALYYLYRPKSLQGIENNNGWIKIENEADLPKENYNQYHVITKTDIYCEIPKNQNIEEFWGNDTNKSAWWMENISHYQPIEKPHKPIY